MRTIVIFFLWIITKNSFAQSSLRFYSNCGEKFYLVIDSLRINQEPSLDHSVSVKSGPINILVYLENSNIPVQKNLSIREGFEYVYRINHSKETKIERDLKYFSHSVSSDMHKALPNSVDSPEAIKTPNMYEIEPISESPIKSKEDKSPALNFPLKAN